MKKRFGKSLVAFALAAAMLFGEVNTVYAAQPEQSTAALEAATDTENTGTEDAADEAAFAAHNVEDVDVERIDELPSDGHVVCGSNGIVYDDVNYLSLFEVSALAPAQQSAYIQACDDISEMMESGLNLKDVDIRLLEQELEISYRVPFTSLYGAIAETADDLPQYSEEIGTVVSLQTMIPGEENFFRDQLNSNEKKYYDMAKKAMVKGSSNKISWTSAPTVQQQHELLNAFSAVIMAYPDHFDWIDKTSEGGVNVIYTYNLFTLVRTYKSINISRSKHYSATLAKSARAKAQSLTQEAYSYAESNYPDMPTYGIVKYFNDWICENSFYNTIGMTTDKKEEQTKEYYYCHSSIGVLLKGYGVCESYALAMNRLLDTAGIPNMYVIGMAGDEAHAWNYVQMPDEKWYLLDSTWNDTGSTTKYFLAGKDSTHKPDGIVFAYSGASSLSFKELTSSKYTGGKETIALSTAEMAVAKGKKLDLAMKSAYYSNFVSTWVSSDPKVIKIDKKGNMKAVNAGKATVSCKIAGKTADCAVYVYQWSGLKFDANQKAAFSTSYGNQTASFDTADIRTYVIHVGQKNGQIKASDIAAMGTMKAPTSISKNSNVATVDSCVLSGDDIILKVQPKATGTTRITVTFEGKKANLTLRVAKQGIQENWFDFSTVTDTKYTGKAIKPKVTKSAAAPADLKKFAVTYTNNKEIGTATVTVEGKGNYGGTVTKTFKITGN